METHGKGGETLLYSPVGANEMVAPFDVFMFLDVLYI